jgi:hypothetical protein
MHVGVYDESTHEVLLSYSGSSQSVPSLPSVLSTCRALAAPLKRRRILTPRRLRFGDESFFQEVSLYPGVNFTIDDHGTFGSFQPLL